MGCKSRFFKKTWQFLKNSIEISFIDHKPRLTIIGITVLQSAMQKMQPINLYKLQKMQNFDADVDAHFIEETHLN